MNEEQFESAARTKLRSLTVRQLLNRGGLKDTCSEKVLCEHDRMIGDCPMCDEHTPLICKTCGLAVLATDESERKCLSIEKFKRDGLIAFENDVVKKLLEQRRAAQNLKKGTRQKREAEREAAEKEKQRHEREKEEWERRARKVRSGFMKFWDFVVVTLARLLIYLLTLPFLVIAYPDMEMPTAVWSSWGKPLYILSTVLVFGLIHYFSFKRWSRGMLSAGFLTLIPYPLAIGHVVYLLTKTLDITLVLITIPVVIYFFYRSAIVMAHVISSGMTPVTTPVADAKVHHKLFYAGIVLLALKAFFFNVGGTHEASSSPSPPSPPADTVISHVRLQVNPTPADARVQIMNITAKYSPGMAMPPGRYHLRVTHPSCQPVNEWMIIDHWHSHAPFSFDRKESPPATTPTATYVIGALGGDSLPITVYVPLRC